MADPDGRSLPGIVGSNLVGAMGVCILWLLWCQVEVSTPGWSLVQRIPTDFGVSSQSDRGVPQGEAKSRRRVETPQGKQPVEYLLRLHLTQWLRHCATNRNVTGSIPDGVIGFFHWHNPFGRTMALGSTQPLTEMSTKNISWEWRRLVCRADNLATFMCLLS
jgi:hypothetical protein